jgi:hypothetical protein
MYREIPNPADCDRKLASALSAFEDPESITLPPGATSLQFLQAIYRSPDQPMARRMKAASIAIQYESPKLAVTMAVTDQSWATQLQRCIARSRQADAYRLIEAGPSAGNGHAPVHETAQEVSASAVRRPMTLIRRR